jgi:hypothetical protein
MIHQIGGSKSRQKTDIADNGAYAHRVGYAHPRPRWTARPDPG